LANDLLDQKSDLLDEKKVPLGRPVPEYSVHLDAVRGTAASMVLLFHLRLFFVQSLTNPQATARPAVTLRTAAPAPKPIRKENQTDYAHESVMVFFVLSGFLVGGSVLRMLRQKQWSWKKYLIHRSVRLWMVLLPALVLGYVLDSIGVHYFLGRGTVYDTGPVGVPWDLLARLSPLTFLGNIFFTQGILTSPLGTNQPLWSLANEFWYYIAFPCIALACVRGAALWKRLLFLAAAAAILVFVGGEIALYFTIWLLGVLAALLPLKIPSKLQRPFTVAALLLFAAVNAAMRFHPLSPFGVDLLVACSFFAVLYGILHLREASGDGLYRRCARFMSKISYSLYLTHSPIICMLSAVLVGTFRRMPLNGHTVLLLVEAIVPIFLVACTVHYLFEARTDKVRNYLESKI
jgi:peptidoglycan/LPS O-acetylase OafA/YrhL